MKMSHLQRILILVAFSAIVIAFQNCAGNAQFGTEAAKSEATCGFASAPTSLDRSKTESVTIRLTNSGTENWDPSIKPASVQAVGTRVQSTQAESVKMPTDKVVAPGGYWDVSFQVDSHQKKQLNDVVTLSWTLTAADGQPIGQSCTRNFTVSGNKDWDAQIVSAPIPAEMAPATNKAIVVKVKNTGFKDWVASASETFKFKLDSKQANEALLPNGQTVKAGETRDFNVTVYSDSLPKTSTKTKGSMYRNTEPFGSQLDQDVKITQPKCPAGKEEVGGVCQCIGLVKDPTGCVTVTCSGGMARPVVTINWCSNPNANSNGLQKGDSYPGDDGQFWGWLPTNDSQRSFMDYALTANQTYSYRVKFRPELPSNTVKIPINACTCGP